MNDIARAARVLREGGLVAFPTETVYGLGANALDARAVRRIFELKGRPATSPLIVHVDSAEMAREVVSVWPEEAERLASRYWPGPLTLVLPKRVLIPDEVTAGLPTVGVRVPAHPLALELIRAAGLPLAAPSANRFTQLSPTTAEHVRAAFGPELLVLDGGPTTVGIESTVVSLAGAEPVLLRPGLIKFDNIQRVTSGEVDAAHPAPGMHERHYSPRTRLLLVERGRRPATGRGVYLGIGEGMPGDPREYAAALYSKLHELDRQGLDWIAVERPPDSPAWEAVLDRLTRAASR
jgi:L-threonylcarbamoyladenylate synthase